jgi:hypothetical protein
VVEQHAVRTSNIITQVVAGMGLNEHPLKSRLRAVAEVEGNLKSFVISSEAMNIILIVLILLLLLGGGGGFYFGGPMVGGGIGGLLLVVLILWLLFGRRR